LIRALALAAALTVPALCLASCGAEHRDVQLVLWDNHAGGHGFTCADEDGVPLFKRAQGQDAISLVTDIIEVGGVPGSSLAQLADYCAEHGCPIVEASRSCFRLAVPGDAKSPQDAFDRITAEMRDRHLTVSSDAPDGVVVVRMVVTVQPCAEVMDTQRGFERDELLGCVLSAPFTPDAVTGDVTLDLDVLTGDTRCEHIVCACAEASASEAPACF
jgi:hypothetical protein